jgi:glycosyltransferase involved in cell wall biosynthesis
MAKVGIGMSVFNRDRFLARAIESVVRQSFFDWELHIVDDCSSDNSLSIAYDFASQDSRIHVYPQRPNLGCGRSLRTALNQCETDYLTWVDSDDKVKSDALQVLVDALDHHPSVGMVYSDYELIDEQDNDLGMGDRCRIPYDKNRLLVEFMVFHMRMVRYEDYHIAGGIDGDLRYAIDYDFCLRASECMEINHIRRSLYQYRIHPQNLSSNRFEQVNQARLAVERAMKRRGLNLTKELKVNHQFQVVSR